jgi:hypothetical protein
MASKRLEAGLEARLEKLPKWAWQYIGKLRSDVEFWKEAARQVDEGEEAKISWSMLFGEDVGIPERAEVRMKVEGGEIDFRLRDGAVYVHGSETTLIRPSASNAFTIELRG